jgi:hypothetical protein
LNWEIALENAIRMGININDFNEMTPLEYRLHIKVYNEKLKQDRKDRLALTYLGAAWQRAKKLPDYKRLLGMELPKKKMTNEEMLLKVKQLNAAFGGDTY